jgi:hypothetical protein
MQGELSDGNIVNGGGGAGPEKQFTPKGAPKSTSDTFSGIEKFVDAEVVADFLSIRRDEVLKLSREGAIRSYPYRGQQRHTYRYRLSEVSADFAALLNAHRSTITAAAPVSRRKKSNG